MIAGFTTFLTWFTSFLLTRKFLALLAWIPGRLRYYLSDCCIRQYYDGTVANLPVALAPAMGLNAFFAFVLCRRWACRGRSGWAQSSGAHWSAVTDDFPRSLLDDSQHSVSLRVGITSGIGLFIGMMGLRMQEWLSLTRKRWSASVIWLSQRAAGDPRLLHHRHSGLANIHAAVLVSIVVTTLLGWMLVMSTTMASFLRRRA